MKMSAFSLNPTRGRWMDTLRISGRDIRPVAPAGLVIALFLCIVAGANAGADELPANAQVNQYVEGWKCNLGYQRVEESCEAVVLPPNAHLDPAGDRWACDRGRQEVSGTCDVVAVPAHAFLSIGGRSWE